MKNRIKYFIVILLISFSAAVCGQIFAPVVGNKAMVATDDPPASAVGLEILKQGGNAVDAAVAVAFTLAVTYPQAGNIGGGGFMVLRTADKKVYTLDYRERAPLKGFRDMYLDSNGNVISDLSITGYLAAGVPGTVKGLWLAHKRFGRLKWRSLIEPAINFPEIFLDN